MEQFFESELCIRCRGRNWCGKSCRVYARINKFLPKAKTHFSGSTPPEIFVGRNFYPEVYTGILAPQYSGNTEEMSLPEKWHSNNLSIKDIVNHRAQLIYSRFKSKIKSAKQPSKFLQTLQEVSLTSKSVSTEVFLKKPFQPRIELDKRLPVIGNPAPLKSIRLEENTKIKKKIDYLVNDTDNKAASSIIELHKTKTTETSNIIKILSAGMLGLKKNRILVPTRWSVTAVDDTISKNLVEKIKYYPEINEIRLFHGYYVGNHYEILLLPDKFSFEVIEAFFTGSAWNMSQKTLFTHDFERFFKRKKYAKNVVGAYYAVRLAISEYLEKIKRQAYCIVFREERPEYNAPLGVGILRQLARKALTEKYETFPTIKEALNQAQTRLKLNIKDFTEKSILLKEYGQQKRLTQWMK